MIIALAPKPSNSLCNVPYSLKPFLAFILTLATPKLLPVGTLTLDLAIALSLALTITHNSPWQRRGYKRLAFLLSKSFALYEKQSFSNALLGDTMKGGGGVRVIVLLLLQFAILVLRI